MLIGLVAAVAFAQAPLTIAFPGMNGVNLAPGEADLHAEVLAQRLSRSGVRVMTARDIGALLGVERQQQMMGCSENNACLTEIVGGLGAEALLVGDLGKLGDEYAINVKVLSTKDSRILAMHNLRAPSVKEVPQALEIAGWELLTQLAQSTKRPTLAPTTSRPTLRGQAAAGGLSPKWWALLPAAIGVAGLSVGLVMQSQAQTSYDALGVAPSLSEATALRDRGAGAQTLAQASFIGAGVGAAAAVALLLFLPSESGVQASLWVAPDNAGLALSGRLP